MKISILEETGDFAEDKDVAAAIRHQDIAPQIDEGRDVTLDFSGVTLATQSFVHALISDVLRRHGEPVLGRLVFKGCTGAIKGIIATVVQYSLETIEE